LRTKTDNAGFGQMIVRDPDPLPAPTAARCPDASGWFAYLRIYGPEKPAFDGSWKPEDFQAVD
jgi:hypothetical protein